MFEQGWIALHRKIQSSPVWNISPCTREVFLYLLLEANHTTKESSGRIILRGQTFRNRSQIAEALSWKVGYRAVKYSAKQISTALDNLDQLNMIKVADDNKTRGLLITVSNYDTYQNIGSEGPVTKERRKALRREGRREDLQSDESYIQQGLSGNNETTKGSTKATRRESTGNTKNNHVNNGTNNNYTQSYSPEQINVFSVFERRLSELAPSVEAMKEPLTIEQYFKIKAKMPEENIYKLLERMDNWEKLKTRSSAYKTLLTFFDRQTDKPQPPAVRKMVI
jgi:hypothetical protein